MSISCVKLREIIKEVGFKYLATRKIQSLNTVQITIHYNFAYNYLDAFTEDDPFWKMIVFTDECRFCASDGGTYCWRKTNDFRKEVCETFEKFSVSCMVWGSRR